MSKSKLKNFFLPRPPLIGVKGGAVMREFSCVSLDWVRIPASTRYIRGSSFLFVLALVLRDFFFTSPEITFLKCNLF